MPLNLIQLAWSMHSILAPAYIIIPTISANNFHHSICLNVERKAKRERVCECTRPIKPIANKHILNSKQAAAAAQKKAKH